MPSNEISPILYPNTSLSYGYWTGALLSAGIEIPPLAPLPPATGIGQAGYITYDNFDAVSRTHDNAYGAAEQTFLNALQDVPSGGATPAQAVSAYLRVLCGRPVTSKHRSCFSQQPLRHVRAAGPPAGDSPAGNPRELHQSQG